MNGNDKSPMLGGQAAVNDEQQEPSTKQVILAGLALIAMSVVFPVMTIGSLVLLAWWIVDERDFSIWHVLVAFVSLLGVVGYHTLVTLWDS